ncbi:uncharacterized protein LOC114746111 [Neltuma alba]|uniref:uncharacterized protein LOC114746111 n=1 Tax=Neltuma alba TaxID=207710 RepID=UPI0010A38D4B|nr:uncharacterized protein LOC114746111 [Prosopis alba]
MNRARPELKQQLALLEVNTFEEICVKLRVIARRTKEVVEVRRVENQARVARYPVPTRGVGKGSQYNSGSSGRAYAMTNEEASASPNLIRANIILQGHVISTLFDSGATHSFISLDCAQKLSLPMVELPYNLRVSTLAWVIIITGRRLVTIRVGVLCTELLGGPVLLSAAQVDKAVKKGCQAFIVFFSINRSEAGGIEQIDVVKEYPEVFPDEVAALPPEQEVEFSIELILGTTLISKAQYKMSPSELVELKKAA